jgi:heat shock protein HslJ
MKQLHSSGTISILLILILSACSGISQAGEPPLEGTAWVLTSYNDSLPIDGTQTTIQFEDGEVSGSAGCNHYGGSYQIKGDTIRFEGLYSTEMACMDPPGVMEQEQAYLDLLRSSERIEMSDDLLTIYAGSQEHLIFAKLATAPQIRVPTTDPDIAVVTTSEANLPEPAPPQPFEPPADFKLYRDDATGVSVHIPDGWVVSGIRQGRLAILQSYPEGKYVGGEPFEAGDTKCDLNIHEPGGSVEETIQRWKSSPLTTIISEMDIILLSGQPGKRLEIENMGRSVVMLTEVNGRTLTLTCFGEPEPFDQIAATLKTSE